jgi:hypothetical protein
MTTAGAYKHDSDLQGCTRCFVGQLEVLLLLFVRDNMADTYLLTCLLTYLLTPWSRVLFVKLTVSQLVRKFPTFYATRRFITAFTSARHLSLS